MERVGLLDDAERRVVVAAVVGVRRGSVGQPGAAPDDVLLVGEGQVDRGLRHLRVDLLVELAGLVGVGLLQRLVEEAVDGLVVQLGEVVVTALEDEAAVDQRLEEALARREVGAPAHDDDAVALVLDDLRRTDDAGGLGAVELVDLGVDADGLQRLLEGLGGRDLDLLVVADRDRGLEAFRLTALLEGFLRLGDVRRTGELAVRVGLRVGTLDRRRQHVGGDVATGLRATTGGLEGLRVGRVDDGLAALDVGDHRLREDRVADEARLRVVDVALVLLEHLLARGGADTRRVDVEVVLTLDQTVVHVVGVRGERDADLVRQGLADGVRLGVPLVVADKLDGLVRGVRLPLVRTGGEGLQLVLGLGVLVLADRGRGGHGQHLQEVTVGDRQLEDDGLVVRGLDRLQAELVRGGVLVGTLVLALGVEDLLEVDRAAGDDVLGPDALDAVLDVLGGDRLAVLPGHPVLQREGVGEAVGRDLAGVGGEVRDELGGGRARLGLEGDQLARVVAREVPHEAVVTALRVPQSASCEPMNFSSPPFLSEGLATLFTAALKPAAPFGPLSPVLLPPSPPHAVVTTIVAAASSAPAAILRL
ncbi:hypothetical protein BLIC30S_01837 [Bacillus licheniformis]